MPGARTQRVIAVASAFALLAATLVLLFRTEPIAPRFWFAIAVTAALVSLVTFLTRRLLFASVITSSLVAVVFLVSLEKQATMHMGLHSYDLFFYLNADTLEFLWGDYRRYVVVVLAAVAAATILAALTWRFDTTRFSRLASGLTLVAAIGAAGAFEPQASAENTPFRLLHDEQLLCLRVLSVLEGDLGHSGAWPIDGSRGANRTPRFCKRVSNARHRRSRRTSCSFIKSPWCRPVCFPGSNMTALSTGFSIPTMVGCTDCA